MSTTDSGIVSLPLDKYRLLVAVQYLNASEALYAGLKRQQATNNFHFVVTLRSFIEYTRRGVWFLAWASEDTLREVKNLTFDKPGSPDLAAMDAKIQKALGKGSKSPLLTPIE
jgi:hypothetical protein